MLILQYVFLCFLFKRVGIMLKMLLRSSALVLLMSAAFSPAKTIVNETGENKIRSSKRSSSEEGKDYSLSKALNSQLEMDEKTNLPTGWNLVRNRESDRPLSITKKRVGIEILGDDYTFYHDLSGLKNFDKTTFLFSVELRSTNPGVRIQYYDGKKDVTSPSYKSKKGEWEILNIEFIVDGNALFHRLYSAILGSVKNNDKPSVDILHIKLQQKQLSSAPVIEEKKTEQLLFGVNLKSADSKEKPIETAKMGESPTSMIVVPQLMMVQEEVDKVLLQSQPGQPPIKQDDKSQTPGLVSPQELMNVKYEKKEGELEENPDAPEVTSQPTPAIVTAEEEGTKLQQSQQEQEDKLRKEQQQHQHQHQEKEKALSKCKEAEIQFKELERKALEVPFSKKANKHIKTKEERDNAIKHKMKELYAYVKAETGKIQNAELGKKTHEVTELFTLNKKTYQDSAVNYFAWLNGAQAQEAEHLQVHSEHSKKTVVIQQMENQFLEWLQSSNPQSEDLLKTLAKKFLEEQQSSQRKLLIRMEAKMAIKKFEKDTGYKHTLSQTTQDLYENLAGKKGSVTIENKPFKMTLVDSNGDKKESLGKKVKRILKSQGSSPFEVHIFSDSSQEVSRFILLGNEKYAAALLLEPVFINGEFSENKK